jgi:hypothetical protein
MCPEILSSHRAISVRAENVRFGERLVSVVTGRSSSCSRPWTSQTNSFALNWNISTIWASQNVGNWNLLAELPMFQGTGRRMFKTFWCWRHKRVTRVECPGFWNNNTMATRLSPVFNGLKMFWNAQIFGRQFGAGGGRRRRQSRRRIFGTCQSSSRPPPLHLVLCWNTHNTDRPKVDNSSRQGATPPPNPLNSIGFNGNWTHRPSNKETFLPGGMFQNTKRRDWKRWI